MVRNSSNAGGAHVHGAAALRAGARYQTRLLWSFAIIVTFFIVELVAALLTKSLALLSDAGHMLTDVVGLGMALAAIQLANRGGESPQRTFGLYRLEILAALANGVLLFGVAIYIFFEAVRRFLEPPEIPSIPLLLVAVLGLAANLAAFALLRKGSEESLNIRGAYLEVLSDTLGSVGVIIAAVVLATTGWPYIDPIVGVGIGLFILPRTYRLTREAVRIIIQAAPPDVDLASVERDLRAIDGVFDVHDLHVWTLTSEMEVASAHVAVKRGTDPDAVLSTAQGVLRDKYRVVHATLQVDDGGCRELGW